MWIESTPKLNIWLDLAQRQKAYRDSIRWLIKRTLRCRENGNYTQIVQSPRGFCKVCNSDAEQSRSSRDWRKRRPHCCAWYPLKQSSNLGWWPNIGRPSSFMEKCIEPINSYEKSQYLKCVNYRFSFVRRLAYINWESIGQTWVLRFTKAERDDFRVLFRAGLLLEWECRAGFEYP